MKRNRATKGLTKAHGRYLTKDLVLAYLNAVAAGDLDTKVDL